MVPKVSLIITVHNSEKTIGLCLDSLMELDYPKEYLEIIAVDNNSTDSGAEIIRGYPVKYVFEERPSIAGARNRGIRESGGEIIAFIDSDCIADKNWLRRIIAPLKSDEIGGAGGAILSHDPQNFIEKYIDFDGSCYCQCGEVQDVEALLPWITTANSAFKRDVFIKAGLFDDSLSRNSDLDLTTRMILAGYNIRFVPDALVYHKHRNSFRSFCKWHFDKGRAFPQLVVKYREILKMNFAASPFQIIVRQAMLGAKALQKIVKEFFMTGNRYSPVFCALEVTAKISFSLGYFYGWLGVASGIIKTSPLTVNSKNKLLCWNEGERLAIFDFSGYPSVRYSLNETGRRVWELMALHKNDRAKITEIITQEYDGQKEVIQEDVERLLGELQEIGA